MRPVGYGDPHETTRFQRNDEAEGIRLAQLGDAGAFERIYRLHSRRVYALCLRMVGNTSEAEDLTQDAFLQLFRKIANISWGVRVLNLAAPACSQCCVDEVAERKRCRKTRWMGRPDPDDESSGPRREIVRRTCLLTGLDDPGVHLERADRAVATRL